MIKIHRLICTCLGIGYIGKGSGTLAALVCCVGCYLIFRSYGGGNFLLPLGSVILFGVGQWSATQVEALWGKDSSKVVIDEVLGMCVSLCWLPVQVSYYLAAFLLFRFFDILKPLFIKRLEALPGGWGVMADDLLAGIYTNIILQVFVLKSVF